MDALKSTYAGGAKQKRGATPTCRYHKLPGQSFEMEPLETPFCCKCAASLAFIDSVHAVTATAAHVEEKKTKQSMRAGEN